VSRDVSCFSCSQRHEKHCILVYMVLFMMKNHLLSIKIDSQPLLFLSGILNGVSVETPLDPPLVIVQK